MEGKIKKRETRTIRTSLITVHGSRYILLPKKIVELYSLNECKRIKLKFTDDKFILKPLQGDEL